MYDNVGFDVECEIGDLARRRIPEYIFMHLLNRPVVCGGLFYGDIKSDCVAHGNVRNFDTTRHVHVPATVGDWCVVDGSSGPISVFGTRGNLIALCLNAFRSHSARARPRYLASFPQAESKPFLSQKGIVSFKVHRFIDLPRDRRWTPLKRRL